MSITQYRQPHHEIAPIFVSRWSARAYTGEAIPDDVLFSAIEAARWAPSAGNSQPWRFIYAKRDSERWSQFLALVNKPNQRWSAKASALVLLLSRKTRDSEEGPRPLSSHSFDAGAAWSNFAHQAHLLGWSARAIGGFDRDATRTLLNIPEDYAIEVIIAIGKPGAKEELPADLLDRETPTDRLPVSAVSAEGRFAFA